MLRIREIAEDELEDLVSVALEAQPREQATVSGFVDWRNQAGDMVWLLAERDEDTVGAGYALVGWHTPPHRAIGAAFVPPGRAWRRASGSPSSTRSRAGRPSTTARSSKGPVSEDDEGSLAWAARHGYHEIGPELPARPRPDVGRDPGAGAAGGDRDRDVGRPARARAGTMGGRTRGDARHPGRGGGRHRHARGMARARHAGRERRPARRLRRARARRGRRLRQALVLGGQHRASLPRPHRSQAGPPRPRHRRRAQADADRLGEGERLHARCRPRTRSGTSRSAASTSGTATCSSRES